MGDFTSFSLNQENPSGENCRDIRKCEIKWEGERKILFASPYTDTIVHNFTGGMIEYRDEEGNHNYP